MKPTTVGVIGIGRIGRMHTENLVHAVPNARVKAVASPRLDKAWAENLGIPVRATDVDVVLNDPEIEAVVITAPSGKHVELIRRAAAARKHIFCEKPVAFEPQAIQQAQAAVDAAGVKLQVGFNRRFDPSLLQMWLAVRGGKVGEIHQLRVTNRDPKAPPVDFVKRSGGLFFDFAIHDFDTVRFLSGSEIVELFAVGAVLVDPEIGKAGDVDTAVITLRLANGALGVIDCSRQTNYGYDQRFEVFGSKGSTFVDNTTATTVVSSSKRGVVADKPHETFVERYREAFVAELAAFVASVREGLPVRVSVEDALAAVRAAGAARTSHLEHRPVLLSEAVQSAGGGQRQ
ncbi:MAG: inositol 2-dehydrogenase [Acidobacteria bacterium RBG_13_68_16]|nr:MAG: inositol 2-dehydrogenase [Acidobacteria bacterium RBG_13_68_16]